MAAEEAKAAETPAAAAEPAAAASDDAAAAAAAEEAALIKKYGRVPNLAAKRQAKLNGGKKGFDSADWEMKKQQPKAGAAKLPPHLR